MKAIMVMMMVLLAGSASAAHRTPMQPKITEAAARATAQARVPKGHVKSHELEREGGRLIYSYDFVVPGKTGIDEVNVDAMTGTVVAVAHENPKAEKKELAKEKKEGTRRSS